MTKPGWKNTLDDVVSRLQAGGPRAEYPLRRLQSTLGPVRKDELLHELNRLVEGGRLVPFYRVRSRATGSGLNGEYSSIIDIPKKVFDETSDRFQDVELTDIELVYRGPSQL